MRDRIGLFIALGSDGFSSMKGVLVVAVIIYSDGLSGDASILMVSKRRCRSIHRGRPRNKFLERGLVCERLISHGLRNTGVN